MNRQIPFVQRASQLCPRRGYSTALSARYDGWAGLYDGLMCCVVCILPEAYALLVLYLQEAIKR